MNLYMSTHRGKTTLPMEQDGFKADKIFDESSILTLTSTEATTSSDGSVSTTLSSLLIPDEFEIDKLVQKSFLKQLVSK